MFKKLLKSILALLLGPVCVLVTSLFFPWSVYGGIATAFAVSLAALLSIWKKDGEPE